MTRNDQLSAKQQQVITLLLSGLTITASAQQAGINEKTIRRWMDEPMFKIAYQQALDGLHETAMTTLQANAQAAVSTVVAIMNDETSDTTPRLRAAKIVLDYLAAKYTTQAQAQGSEQETPYDSVRELLQYCTDDELQTLRPILASATLRKQEALHHTSNITPIRPAR